MRKRRARERKTEYLVSVFQLCVRLCVCVCYRLCDEQILSITLIFFGLLCFPIQITEKKTQNFCLVSNEIRSNSQRIQHLTVCSIEEVVFFREKFLFSFFFLFLQENKHKTV